MRLSILLGLIAFCIAQGATAQQLRNHDGDAAGGLPVPAGVSRNVGVSRQPLWAAKSTIWTISDIPVCWENPDRVSPETKNAIRDRIALTWEIYSTLHFTGWEKCSSNARGIRIQFETKRSHTIGLGSRIDGVHNGMRLNPDDGDLPRTAVHEFGHALGFSHEQNRSDAPAWCRDMEQGSDGDIYMTPYDASSVMNYCSPGGDNFGNLSGSDIAGLQFWYGTPAQGGTPWLPDCRLDAVLFEKDGYGGRSVVIRGSMSDLDIEHFNDAASAVCVPAGFMMIAYEDRYFRGRSITWHGPAVVAKLGRIDGSSQPTWNDLISSLRLVDERMGIDVYEAQSECRGQVLGFSGYHFTYPVLFVNGDIADLHKPLIPPQGDFNDKLSSLCVPAGKTVTLFKDTNYRGASISITGPAFVQNLNDRGWNDRASSIQLR